jgi:predicted nucleic acid-binding protein
VYVEVHLVLKARGHLKAAVTFGQAILEGTHLLDRPTDGEHHRALEIMERFETAGVDLADAVVMAMAEAREALILTWDFRHFRGTAPGRRRHWPLLVQEHEIPR